LGITIILILEYNYFYKSLNGFVFMLYGSMVYLEVESEVLMIKKNIRDNDPNSGRYTLPGGKFEEKELFRGEEGRLESAIREVKDETGIMIFNPTLRGVVYFGNEDRYFPDWKNPKNFYVEMYFANFYDLDSKLKESDEGVPVWVPKKKINDFVSEKGDRLIYDWINEGRNFSGTVCYKGKELDSLRTFVNWF
jgi:ADP-ribose pyrophosphatase YjhB (NUDIX family)